MTGIILGDRYELLEKIGEGGMSEVYKARCNKLNRLVAIKILKKEFTNNEEIAQKFKREATAIANLSDANIVNVLDVGTQEDIDYIVMEYVNGKTLKDVINFSGKLGYSTAIKIALQIAKALDCAHKNNIIHRDVKPQNVLVMESGEVKVTDFGIAKSTDSNTITNTTSIIGSAHYLSPEQARGTYVDARADIYSFGVLMYEMVTGKLPFDGDSPVTVALKHLQDEPVAPKVINAAVPESLNKLILKAMEKDTVKRYQNAKEIIADLQRIQQDPDVKIIEDIDNDDGKTIIMSAIPNGALAGNTTVSNSKGDEDHYDDEDDYDDDEYYDDEDEDDYEVPKKQKNKKSKSKVLYTVLVVLILGLIFGIGFYFIGGNSNKQIQMPNVIGKSLKEATKILGGLEIKIEVQREDSDKPVDEVLRIEPNTNTYVNKGDTVKIIVSAGKQTFEMINIVDKEVNEAISALNDAGIKHRIEQKYSDTVPKDHVISTDPKYKEKASLDREVVVTVSLGKEIKTVIVPNVISLNGDVAKQKLEQEFKLSVSTEYRETSEKEKDGIVIDQTIEPDQEVLEGSKITIFVGRYKEPEKTYDVSSYVGRTVKELVSYLKQIGIDYNPKEIDQNAIIKSVSSSGGDIARVKKGDVVTIKIEEKKPDDSTGADERENH